MAKKKSKAAVRRTRPSSKSRSGNAARVASSSSPAARKLKESFKRNGYVRRQSRSRMKTEGYGEYKKGDEVRLVAETRAELNAIRAALKLAGFEPSRPFAKGRQWAQPIYGRDHVARFLKLIGA